MQKFTPKDDEVNMYLAHVAFRLADSADTLRAVADKLDGRECISVAELSEVREGMAAVARSLDAADGLTRYFAEDITNPATLTRVERDRLRAAQQDSDFRAAICAALAGEARA